MPRPYLGEIAYAEYCHYVDQAKPAWETLSLTERLAWGRAVRAALAEALSQSDSPLSQAGHCLGKSKSQMLR